MQNLSRWITWQKHFCTTNKSNWTAVPILNIFCRRSSSEDLWAKDELFGWGCIWSFFFTYSNFLFASPVPDFWSKDENYFLLNIKNWWLLKIESLKIFLSYHFMLWKRIPLLFTSSMNFIWIKFASELLNIFSLGYKH